MSPAGKTVAEYILDIVKLLNEDVDEMKEKLGPDTMEPLDRRLKRVEAKLHSIGDGTWAKQDDGMDQRR